MGHPEWRDDPRYATNSARMQNLDALTAEMGAVLATRSRAEWMEAFDAAGVPVGPVHTIGEALSHPQTLARNMVVDLEHPQAGPTKALGCPIHFSKTPTQITRHAPMLGEHSRELLREYGYEDAEIDEFLAEGVIEEPTAAAL
jgi:crotonobetainyl-CoA:carnitine CoA-transferase CaiB-like acyl-CoA transferase